MKKNKLLLLLIFMSKSSYAKVSLKKLVDSGLYREAVTSYENDILEEEDKFILAKAYKELSNEESIYYERALKAFTDIKGPRKTDAQLEHVLLYASKMSSDNKNFTWNEDVKSIEEVIDFSSSYGDKNTNRIDGLVSLISGRQYEAYFMIGSSFLERGALGYAQYFLGRAISSMNPYYYKALLSLGLIAFTIKNYDLSEKLLKRGLKGQNIDRENSLYLISEIYKKRREIEKAKKYFNELASLKGSYLEEAILSLIELKSDRVRFWLDFASKNISSLSFSRKIIKELIEQGLEEEAIFYMSRITLPEDIKSIYSELLLKKGDYSKAIRELDSSKNKNYSLKIKAFFKAGDYNKVLSLANYADNSDDFYYLAMANKNLGFNEEARSNLKISLEKGYSKEAYLEYLEILIDLEEYCEDLLSFLKDFSFDLEVYYPLFSYLHLMDKEDRIDYLVSNLIEKNSGDEVYEFLTLHYLEDHKSVDYSSNISDLQKRDFYRGLALYSIGEVKEGLDSMTKSQFRKDLTEYLLIKKSFDEKEYQKVIDKAKKISGEYLDESFKLAAIAAMKKGNKSLSRAFYNMIKDRSFYDREIMKLEPYYANFLKNSENSSVSQKASYNLGVQSQERGFLDEALSHFIRLSEELEDGYIKEDIDFRIAKIYLQKKEYQKTLKSFENIKGPYKKYIMEYLLYYLKENFKDKFIEVENKSEDIGIILDLISFFEESEDIVHLKADMLYEIGLLEKASALFKALGDNEKLAKSYLKAQKYKEITLLPEDEISFLDLVEAYINLGNYRDAIEKLRNSKDIKGVEERYFYNLAYANYKLGDFDRASKIADSFLDRFKKSRYSDIMLEISNRRD